MRVLLILLFTSAMPARAAVCGLFQVEDFSGRIVYTMTRFAGGQTVYNITNPSSEIVKNMIRGVCYCAEGPTLPIPNSKVINPINC